MFYIENLVFGTNSKMVFTDLGESKTGYEELLHHGYFLETSIKNALKIFKRYNIICYARDGASRNGSFAYVYSTKGRKTYKVILLKTIDLTLRQKFKNHEDWTNYANRNILGRMMNIFCNVMLKKNRKINLDDLSFLIDFLSEYKTKNNVQYYEDKQMEYFFNYMTDINNYDKKISDRLIIKIDPNEGPDEATLSINYDGLTENIDYKFINGDLLVFEEKKIVLSPVKALDKNIKDPFNQVTNNEHLMKF